MQKHDKIRFQHMLDAIEEAISFAETHGSESLAQTERLSSLPQIQGRDLSAIVAYAGRHLTP